MAKLKIETAKGFTKAEAFAKTELSKKGVTLKGDATTAFNKEERPIGAYLNAFATDYVERRVKGATGIGFSITLESGVADSRERPYKVTNITTEGARVWKTVYQGFVGADPVTGLGGTLVLSKDTKGDAEEAGKVYTTDNKVDVVIRLGKEVTGSKIKDGDKVKLGAAQNVAMIIKYTPSINTVEGDYIFFGYEAE